jgi:putative membrane-bound dehydrogenase-like protein
MWAAPLAARDVQLGLRVPPGFEVTEFADSKLANDIFCMTLDPRGRVVVSGRGYIRILIDDDNDGRADRAIDFASGPKDGAQGLLWEGSSLYFTGDGGLRRYRDENGDDRADGPSELIRAMNTGGEHHAHAIRRGPDGRLYLLCGNTTGIDKTFAQLPTSPIKDPVAGCVLRFTPDLKQSEIVADGFRNPYDMDFNLEGDLFTFDSDNERCVSLPWYESTRFYQVIAGGHYGWQAPQRAMWWRMPPYFFDVVAPITHMGRGSPTGVTCYRHVQFPERYRGGFFLLDWTFGRVYFVSLQRSGSTYTCQKEVFLESVGDNGFAPTASVVHPKTGDLYISIGGRGTRGAVYRIRYPKGVGATDPAAVAKLGVKPRSPEWQPAVQRVEFQKGGLNALADVLDNAESSLKWEKSDPDSRLKLIRLIQLALGDLISPKVRGTVWEGYTLRQDRRSSTGFNHKGFAATVRMLRKVFPSGHADLDREISRTLALIEDDDPALLGKMADRISPTSDPVEDIHYLIVLARLGGPRPAALAKQIASALLSLDRKISERHLNRDSHWPLRVAELHAELARKDPELNTALLSSPDFGRPDHALFARCPGFDQRKAAEIFLARAAKDEDYPWNPVLVEIIGTLPEEQSLPVLHRLWNKGGLEESILPVLARHPQPADRGKFLEGLASPQLRINHLCLDAMEKLPPAKEGTHVLALVRFLRRLPEGREENKLRDRLVKYLQWLTAQDKLGSNKQAWTEWFIKTYPNLATKLGGADGVDVSGWNQRLAKIDWSRGDAERGRSVFTQASCAACHSGAQALGPDLHGVAGRFSRGDLFTAILQPSLDISPRYRTTLVATAEDKVYQGIVIYEAVDSLILQTGPATTIRLVNQQITARRVTETSLMPTGLLDKLTDREIADLYAYLKSLGNSPGSETPEKTKDKN